MGRGTTDWPDSVRSIGGRPCVADWCLCLVQHPVFATVARNLPIDQKAAMPDPAEHLLVALCHGWGIGTVLMKS